MGKIVAGEGEGANDTGVLEKAVEGGRGPLYRRVERVEKEIEVPAGGHDICVIGREVVFAKSKVKRQDYTHNLLRKATRDGCHD